MPVLSVVKPLACSCRDTIQTRERPLAISYADMNDLSGVKDESAKRL